MYAARNERLCALIDYKMVVDQNPTRASAFLELGILNMAISNDHEQTLHYLDEAIRLGKFFMTFKLFRSQTASILFKSRRALSYDV